MNEFWDGVIARTNVKVDTIRVPGHGHVTSAMELVPDQGVLKCGTVLAKNGAGLGVPFDELGEVIGTGTGSTKNFSGAIAGAPLQPGLVSVTDDGTETFADDGLGNLIGSAGGSGTVVYKTGAVTVSFDAAVANTVDVTATAGREIAEVLDGDVDTAARTVGETVIHGTVAKARLLKGPAGSQVACGPAEFEQLRKLQIFPV